MEDGRSEGYRLNGSWLPLRSDTRPLVDVTVRSADGASAAAVAVVEKTKAPPGGVAWLSLVGVSAPSDALEKRTTFAFAGGADVAPFAADDEDDAAATMLQDSRGAPIALKASFCGRVETAIPRRQVSFAPLHRRARGVRRMKHKSKRRRATRTSSAAPRRRPLPGSTRVCRRRACPS